MKVSVWDSYNLSLFSNTLFLMTDQMTMAIIRDLPDLQDHNNYIVIILINAIDCFYRRKKITIVKGMIQQIERELIPSQDDLIVRFKLTFFKKFIVFVLRSSQGQKSRFN